MGPCPGEAASPAHPCSLQAGGLARTPLIVSPSPPCWQQRCGLTPCSRPVSRCLWLYLQIHSAPHRFPPSFTLPTAPRPLTLPWALLSPLPLQSVGSIAARVILFKPQTEVAPELTLLLKAQGPAPGYLSSLTSLAVPQLHWPPCAPSVTRATCAPGPLHLWLLLLVILVFCSKVPSAEPLPPSGLAVSCHPALCLFRTLLRTSYLSATVCLPW